MATNMPYTTMFCMWKTTSTMLLIQAPHEAARPKDEINMKWRLSSESQIWSQDHERLINQLYFRKFARLPSLSEPAFFSTFILQSLIFGIREQLFLHLRTPLLLQYFLFMYLLIYFLYIFKDTFNLSSIIYRNLDKKSSSRNVWPRNGVL